MSRPHELMLIHERITLVKQAAGGGNRSRRTAALYQNSLDGLNSVLFRFQQHGHDFGAPDRIAPQLEEITDVFYLGRFGLERK